MVFGGTYAPGSEGNDFAREMVNYLRTTLHEVHPVAVLFDLTALEYVWGDAIAGLAMPLMEQDKPLHFLPSAIVAAGPTALALKPLLEPRWALGLAGMKLFGARKEALAYLEKNVYRQQRTRAQQERDMAKHGFDTWPVVEATLRSAVFQSEGLGAGPAAALRQIPFLEIIWGLVALVRGHQVRFLYTYIAGGQYRVGYADQFVRSTSDAPRLFGRVPGETIYVRYNPEKPAVSVALAWDNPGR